MVLRLKSVRAHAQKVPKGAENIQWGKTVSPTNGVGQEERNSALKESKTDQTIRKDITYQKQGNFNLKKNSLLGCISTTLSPLTQMDFLWLFVLRMRNND